MLYYYTIWTYGLFLRYIARICSYASCLRFVPIRLIPKIYQRFVHTLHSYDSFLRLINDLFLRLINNLFLRLINDLFLRLINDLFLRFIPTIYQRFVPTLHSYDFISRRFFLLFVPTIRSYDFFFPKSRYYLQRSRCSSTGHRITTKSIESDCFFHFFCYLRCCYQSCHREAVRYTFCTRNHVRHDLERKLVVTVLSGPGGDNPSVATKIAT